MVEHGTFILGSAWCRTLGVSLDMGCACIYPVLEPLDCRRIDRRGWDLSGNTLCHERLIPLCEKGALIVCRFPQNRCWRWPHSIRERPERDWTYPCPCSSCPREGQVALSAVASSTYQAACTLPIFCRTPSHEHMTVLWAVHSRISNG